MKTKHLLALTCLLPLGLTAHTPEPTSALQYQQTTNTRIVVEENYLRFFTGGSERMTVDANGNVGIGITQPTNRLSIKSDTIGEDILNAFNSDGNEIFEIGTLTDNESYIQVNDKDGNIGLQYRTDNNLFRINNLRITENYSTTSETAWIHYKTGVDRQLGLLLTNDRRTKAEIKLWEGNSHNPYISFSTSSSSSLDMEERMRIDKYGNVGIGITDPVEKLQLGGNLKFQSEYYHIMWPVHSTYPFGGGITGDDGNYKRLTLYHGHSIALETGSNTRNHANTRFYINSLGDVGIGTTSPSQKLDVNGNVNADKFFASGSQVWPDYVFEDTYKLSKIEAVEKYIEENHHLPEIPSAAEVKANGVDIVDMQAKLLQKIEELTLYVIEQNKKIELLKAKIEKR